MGGGGREWGPHNFKSMETMIMKIGKYINRPKLI